jgi:hypothetical protein
MVALALTCFALGCSRCRDKVCTKIEAEPSKGQHDSSGCLRSSQHVHRTFAPHKPLIQRSSRAGANFDQRLVPMHDRRRRLLRGGRWRHAGLVRYNARMAITSNRPVLPTLSTERPSLSVGWHGRERHPPLSFLITDFSGIAPCQLVSSRHLRPKVKNSELYPAASC